MMNLHPLRMLGICLVAAAALVAASCGGGGGGGGGVPTPFALLGNTPGAAEVDDLQLAFSGNGDGVAMWTAESGNGTRLVYALYSAASGTWSADQLLDQAGGEDCCYEYQLAGGATGVAVVFIRGTSVFASVSSGSVFGAPQALELGSDPRLYPFDPEIIASGSGFAATWVRLVTQDPITFNTTAAVRASVLPGAGMPWSAATALGSTGQDVRAARLASNGSGYMATWSQDGDVFANHYGGSGWLGVPLAVDGLATDAHAARIASNGTTYQIIWVQNDGAADSILGREHDGVGALGPIIPLDGTMDAARDPDLISNGSSYCVAWLQSGPSDLTVTIGAGAGPWSLPTVLDDPLLGNGVSQEFRLASNGSGYAALWTQRDAAAEFGIWGSVYSGAWSAAALLDTAPGGVASSWTQLASNGTGYMATWLQFDQAIRVDDLWGNAFASGMWQGAQLLESMDADTDEPSLARRANEYVVGWPQQRTDDSGMDVSVRHYGASWGAVMNLATSPWGGGVYDGFLVPSGSGLTLAAWTVQQGTTSAAYVSVQSAAGVWGLPESLGADVRTEASMVASNGTGFAVATRSDGASSEDRFDVRLFDGTSWGAPTTFGAPSLTGYVQTIALASDGSDYAVVWCQQPDPLSEQAAYGRVYAGGTWGARTLLSTQSSFAQSIHLASNGVGYATTWDPTSSEGVPVNVYDGASWSGEVKAFLPPNPQPFPRIISNGTGYAVYWTFRAPGDTNRNVYVSVSPSGSSMDFGPAQRLSSDLLSADEPKVASDGTGYAVAWPERDNNTDQADLFASTWNGMTWSSATSLEAGANRASGLMLAGAAGGYAAAWRQREGVAFEPETIFANVFSAGSWGGETALQTGATDLWSGPHVAANSAGGYAVAWTQKVAAPAGDDRRHVHLSRFSGSAWATTQLESQAADANRVRVVADGTFYSVIWNQPLPGGDLLVPLPWAWTRITP